jgi:hypothetical protein
VLKKKLAAVLGLGLVVGASAAFGGTAHRADSTGGQPDVVIDVS